MVSRSAARASSFEHEGGSRTTRCVVDASFVADGLGTSRRAEGTGAAGAGPGAGAGAGDGAAFFSRSARNSRNSRGSRWGVIAASRAARLAEALPPPYEVDQAGVAGVAGGSAGASGSTFSSAWASSASVLSASLFVSRPPSARLSLVRARRAFPLASLVLTDDGVLLNAPYARSAAANRSAIASRRLRSRSRAAAARPTGVPPLRARVFVSRSVAQSVRPRRLPRRARAAADQRHRGAARGRGGGPSGPRTARGAAATARHVDTSLSTSNPPTGLTDSTRGKGVRRSSSAAAFNRRACASGDCRATRGDGFGVDVAGPGARGVATRSAAATSSSVSRETSSGATTGAFDVEGSVPRTTPRGCVPACAFARARDSRRRICLSLYGEASSASLARSETFNLALGVVNPLGVPSTERDPEASPASCAEGVSPRPDGASPPESIEAVACVLRQTPHLGLFRATAERCEG
jgi:hypothetical protein